MRAGRGRGGRRWWWWCAVAACALYVASRGLRGQRAAHGGIGSPMRSLPVLYWVHTRQYPDKYRNRDSCIQMPSLQAVEYVTPFWQRVTPSLLIQGANNAQFAVKETLCHSAHWNQHQNDVRVLMHSELDPDSPTLYCHLWYYNSGSPKSVRASVLFDDQLSCRPPSLHPSPAAVTVTAGRCGAALSILAVQGLDEDKSWYNASSVGVCAVWRGVGGAAGHLPAADVAAWLLLLREFGVDGVYLYLMHAPSEVLALLERLSWSTDPMLHVTPYSSPPTSGIEEDGVRLDDATPFNDCVYAARHRHGWLALLELHELIVPLREHSLPALVSAHSSKSDEDVSVLEFPVVADYAEWLQRDIDDADDSDRTFNIEEDLSPIPNRFLDRFWRNSSLAPYEGVTGKLVRASSVSHVGREVSCAGARCGVRRVAAGAARLQRYGARCGVGAATRRECRKTRVHATRDDTLGARLKPGRAAHIRDAMRRLIHTKLPSTHQDY